MAEYIKREDAIALAWETIYEDEWHMHQRDKVVSVSDIAELPSADVVPRKDYESMERTVDKLSKALAERKRGKWVLYNKGFGFTHYCSLCNFTVKEQWIDFYNFCPNCGADNRGSEEEE